MSMFIQELESIAAVEDKISAAHAPKKDDPIILSDDGAKSVEPEPPTTEPEPTTVEPEAKSSTTKPKKVNLSYETLFTESAIKYLEDNSIEISKDDTLPQVFKDCEITLTELIQPDALAKLSIHSVLNNPVLSYMYLPNWNIFSSDVYEMGEEDQLYDGSRMIAFDTLAELVEYTPKLLIELGDIEDIQIKLYPRTSSCDVCLYSKTKSEILSTAFVIEAKIDQLLNKSIRKYSDQPSQPDQEPELVQPENVFVNDAVQKLSMSFIGGAQKQYLLRIPIAQEGKWKHPLYGDLDFSEEKINEINQNLQDDVTGYPIPLYRGHSDTDAKKEGVLRRFERDGELLFGVWETSKETYRAVEDGDYSFSSAEIFPNYMSKKDGRRVGTTLVGMALTNRPFIPNLPAVQALSDSESQQGPQFFSTPIQVDMVDYDSIKSTEPCNNNVSPTSSVDNDDIMSSQPVTQLGDSLLMSTDNNSVEPKTPAVAAEPASAPVAEDNAIAQQFSEQIDSMKAQLSEYSTKLSLVEETYQAKLSEATAKNEDLEARLAKYEQKFQEDELAKKLQWLSELSLPAATKEKYAGLIKEGTLGDSEEVVLNSLSELAQNFSETFTSQVGATSQTDDLNSPDYVDPFASVIERNQKLVEARKSSL